MNRKDMYRNALGVEPDSPYARLQDAHDEMISRLNKSSDNEEITITIKEEK